MLDNDDKNVNDVREILRHDWDPFCVGRNPNLVDEYDPFIPDIIQLLQENCLIKELEIHLAKIETELHAPTSDTKRLRTATSLHNLQKP